jgi:acyl-CoA thioester hydrolase
MSEFRWAARVYWEDTDGGGIVYYANYLRFLERARTEWLRAKGFSQAELARDPGILFTVVSVQVNYRRPARLDDELVITCEPHAEGRASLRFAQRILRGAELLADADVRVACLAAATLRPTRLPESVLAEVD